MSYKVTSARFSKDSKKVLKENIAKDVKQVIWSKKTEIEELGTRNIQNAVRFLGAYDTGNMASRSLAKLFSFGYSFIIRFQTEGVPYANEPRNGEGGSRKYGPRKFDILGAFTTLRMLGLVLKPKPKMPPVGKPRIKTGINVQPSGSNAPRLE